MTEQRILIIGLVWPEPTSSAAGTRMVQLIHMFLAQGYGIFFACAAGKSDFSFDLPGIGVTEISIKLNDPSFALLLREIAPSTVLFDRFVIEEQYGWRVQEECPTALRILDTEDLHCLRLGRQRGLKETSATDALTETAKREIAAILRCDLSLIISEYEMLLLKNEYHIDPALIYYLPFLEEPLSMQTINSWKSFESREGFIFIGNFLHEPNWHTVQVLKSEVWPELRKKLPGVALHVYGAYPSQKVMQLHNTREKFLVNGRAENAHSAMEKHRILLAPIQFGAGLKGKFIDAMQTGTPSITTTVGAEAMAGELEWPGAFTDDPQDFIAEAVKLYLDRESWQNAQQNGLQILKRRYEKHLFVPAFLDKIQELRDHLIAHRNQNIVGQILQLQTVNSSKYMSLWITEKNRNKEQ